MRRDSLFYEKVVWSGGPVTVAAPSLYRAMAWLLGVTSAVSTLLAIAAARSVQLPPGRLIVFAAWCATFGLVFRMVPVIWAQAARFVVTDRHVIWARGSFKRTIQRDSISYARIQWDRKHPGIGDLELVRAVPAGVLQRGLTIVLRGVAAPDRVWSIVRGVPASTSAGDGRRPLAQRLDQGEQVVWTDRPLCSWTSWLPLGRRRLVNSTLGVACAVVAVRTVVTSTPIAKRLLEAGVPVFSLTFLTLVSAFVLTAALLSSVAAVLLYRGILRKPLLDRATRYLITDQRVLIQRGLAEIHLDRTNVVDLVDEESAYGGRDVYLVMDGPRSRGYSASGAFGPGERARGFLPVLCGIKDVDGLRAAFGSPSRSLSNGSA